jgi:DNA-binding transcriptional LysR family regulator
MLRTHPAKVQNASEAGNWQKAAMFDWNDLRTFVAVAETGSTLAAARDLRVSQTTIARRVAALEAALGLRLFERRQAGYALTPTGEALLDDARSVQDAAQRFGDSAASQAREISGTVRLTTMEIYAITVLGPILRDLHHAHPGITIELDTSEALRDLSTGVADVALRTAKEMSAVGLVGRRIAPDPWTVYCSREYADRHGVPRTRAELARHPFIGGGGGVWPPYRAWLQRHDLEDAVIMRHDTGAGLLAGVRAGLGLTILPSFIADREPDLIRCIPPINDDPSSLWLLTHERLRHVPRVRATMDFLGMRLGAMAR